ncbi:MAG: cobalamin B12-binding domain-containing protein [Clostridia bacterium]|nr:cobalamin B12-binding domain-containing protein [Clostridia bacterium]
MKIVLLRPKPDSETIGLQHVMICEPLELEYVGAVLEKDHQVVLYDMILEKKSIEEIIAIEMPDMVCMTGYISHVNILMDYSSRIKQIDDRILTVVGGVHAEVIPKDFEKGSFDYIISANPLDHIVSIANGTTFPRIINADKSRTFEYPHPARHLVDRYRKDYYYMFHNPCSLIKTSFGCPYNCSFCFCKAITDGKYFTRRVEDVIEELMTIDDEEIYVVDDDFLYDEKRLTEFCNAIEAHHIQKKYLVYGRADFVAEHPEMMKRLKAIGLRAVIVGLESYSNKDLDSYNKRSQIGASIACINMLNALDIECYGTFIIGLDWKTSDFKSLRRFIVQTGIQFVNLQPLTPMPGTSLYDSTRKDWIVKADDFAKWDMAHLVLHPEHLSIRRYYFEIVKLYYQVTLRPSMVHRALKKYPFKENLKLTIGANRVMWQYVKRIIKGRP